MTMVMKGFKGFNQKLQCREFQFEIGKRYKEEEAECCHTGFHYCQNPLDVFSYYPPSISRYCEVEGSGIIDIKKHGDTKVAASEIHIGTEIGLSDVVKAGIGYISSKADWENVEESNFIDHSVAMNIEDYSVATNTGIGSVAASKGTRSVATGTGHQSLAKNTGPYSVAASTGHHSVAVNTGCQSVATSAGDCSAVVSSGDFSAATNVGDRSVAKNSGYQSTATNTGNGSVATNTGDHSVATNIGDESVATVEGQDSIACSLGVEGKAKGKKGCWLVLAEWEDGKLIEVKSVLVDGKTIKEDRLYSLIDGHIVEVE